MRLETNGQYPKKAKELGITILNGYEISDTIKRLRVKEVQLKKISDYKINGEKSSITIK